MRALRRLKRFVFMTERKGPFSTAGFARLVERAGAEAGLPFKAHPLVMPVIEKPALTVASANAAMRVATVMPLRGVCAAGTVTGADGTSVTLGSATVGSGDAINASFRERNLFEIS